MIRIRGLQYAYADGRRALDDLEIEVAAGETIGIIGPNGAGKTTLLLCLMGVLECPTNRIDIMGFDPATASGRQQLAGKIGLVFQQVEDQLFAATVEDDVAFAPLNLGLSKAEARERTAWALTSVGLSGFQPRVTLNLSEGEKRRVAIAGVLAMKPEILLLDEPTAGLDPKRRRELIQLLNEIPGTKLIATHDEGLIRKTCQRVWFMNDGKLIQTGPTALLDDTTLLRANGL